MNTNYIDASTGLAFSLILFERYQQDGILQAEYLRVPGINGYCKAYLHFVEGQITDCYLEDNKGQRHSSSQKILSRLDAEKGPFEWNFTQRPSSPLPFTQKSSYSQKSNNGHSFSKSKNTLTFTQKSSYPQKSPIPKPIARLDLAKLTTWDSRYKRALFLVFSMIDGQRSLEEIKSTGPFSSSAVDKALKILLSLNVITID